MRFFSGEVDHTQDRGYRRQNEICGARWDDRGGFIVRASGGEERVIGGKRREGLECRFRSSGQDTRQEEAASQLALLTLFSVLCSPEEQDPRSDTRRKGACGWMNVEEDNRWSLAYPPPPAHRMQ